MYGSWLTRPVYQLASQLGTCVRRWCRQWTLPNGSSIGPSGSRSSYRHADRSQRERRRWWRVFMRGVEQPRIHFRDSGCDRQCDHWFVFFDRESSFSLLLPFRGPRCPTASTGLSLQRTLDVLLARRTLSREYFRRHCATFALTIELDRIVNTTLPERTANSVRQASKAMRVAAHRTIVNHFQTSHRNVSTPCNDSDAPCVSCRTSFQVVTQPVPTWNVVAAVSASTMSMANDAINANAATSICIQRRPTVACPVSARACRPNVRRPTGDDKP